MNIERAFNARKSKADGWSDLMIFNYVITGRGLSKMSLAKAFSKLVDKGDYDPLDKDEILEHSYSLTLEPPPKNSISDDF